MNTLASILALTLWLGLATSEAAPKCGYSSCPTFDANKINVHLIPHTHDDVGWLKTVDQYYYGTRRREANVGVQHILDSVVPQLLMDKSKRFIYVEMSFFYKWWQEQEANTRSVVRQLVNEGRLEFINGGWCMNDEATVNYRSTIEQMTLGLRFLNETFGPCGRPKVGWQIDPFGHSSEQASLFAQFGFDGMFFSRIGYEDKLQRTLNKSLDIIWHGDRALSGQSGSIYTNIFRDGYDPPANFCFDVLCLDNDIVDNKNSYEYNVDYLGKHFVYFIKHYASQKLVNHILVPMGGDFHFSAAHQNFKNIDKLIKFVRSNHSQEINIFYSTPTCYQKAIHEDLQARANQQVRLPEKFDDFMPYDSQYTIWWSGYFSSRPSVKLIEHETANLLQVARAISLANLLRQFQHPATADAASRWAQEVRDHEAKCLQPLWEVLGDLQHHDAITGTERQHVANDYVRRAVDAWTMCANFIGELRRAKLNDHLRKSTKYDQFAESGRRLKLNPVFIENTMLCPLMNISQCDAIESDVDLSRYHHLIELKQANNSSGNTTSATPLRRAQRSALNAKQLDYPTELVTKAVLLNIYNPLSRPVAQHDVRVPCNGRCDLDKVRVIHLSTNETVKLIRLPVAAGVNKLPFRQALTNYELLFYANIPALGYTSYILEDNNDDELVDEEKDHSIENVSTTRSGHPADHHANIRNSIRSRKSKRSIPDEQASRYEYFELACDQEGRLKQDLPSQGDKVHGRDKRDTLNHHSDRVIIKFDLHSGMIVGLKRASDGNVLNITQKFGYYFPSDYGTPPGAYTFRPNSSEPVLLDKPLVYKMYKRKDGALIEIHQKWADWIWQTIRVDARRNYIEFDYLVGPIPVKDAVGRDVITRYITNLDNDGVFLTDSNSRQLLPRHRRRSMLAEHIGGSFYPVVSTLALRNIRHNTSRPTAEAVAILVDRPQAGSSLHEGQMEFLIHRLTTTDDSLGVSEPLEEPGEDGRGLVTRGQHRLYLKFQDTQASSRSTDQAHNDHNRFKHYKTQMYKLPETPKSNIEFEKESTIRRALYSWKPPVELNIESTANYLIHDSIFDDLNLQSRRMALQPIITYDRLRVTTNEFIEMLHAGDSLTKVKTDLTLLNNSLPSNVHLLTLQPLATQNELLIRLENLNNPLLLHPLPDYIAYNDLVSSYSDTSDVIEVDAGETCPDKARPVVEFDIEYLIRKIRIVSLTELTLGANAKLSEDKRLNWTEENNNGDTCESSGSPTTVTLAPRQIRTFLAKFVPF